MLTDDLFSPDIALLDRYLAGELAADDVTRVDEWLASRADRHALVNSLRAQASGQVTLERAPDLERGLALLQGLKDSTSPGDVQQQVSTTPADEHGRRAVSSARMWSRRVSMSRAWYTLVGLALGVTAMVAAWQTGMLTSFDRVAVPGSVYTTANGQRANITLSDGSVVALNVASRLEVPGDYAAGNHTVRLTGEALFTATHHTGAPLTVIAGPLVTRVLGTSFLVRHYASDTTATVAVRDGKVSVQTRVLTTGQQLIMGTREVVRVQPVDPTRFGFATGVLALNGMQLKDALPELNRWYDIDLRLGDAALATRRITVECRAGSLADLISILEWTFDLHVVRNGRVLTLMEKR